MTTILTDDGRQRPVGRIREKRARHKHAKRLWQQARTLADLGEATAQWLEGTIASHPGYYGRPDTETRDLVPVLATLNRAGYITTGSQPGKGPEPGWDGQQWWQRAAVDGFADDATLGRIRAAVDGTELILVTHRTERRRLFDRFRANRDGAVPVTASAERVHTCFGGRMTQADIGLCLEWIGADAYDEVLAAWQVTVIDPDWGRHDRLWPLLEEALRR